MRRLFTAILGWLLSATLALAGGTGSFPAASIPYSATDQILGTQPAVTGATVNYTPAGLAAYVGTNGTTTGPYSGQVPQPLGGGAPQGCLPVFSYLTAAQQAAVQAGTSTVDFQPIEAEMETALAVNTNTVFNGTNCEFWPPGLYHFSSTVNLKHTVRIYAPGTGMAGGQATIWRFPADTLGVVINRSNTLNETTVSATTGADGSTIDGIFISSPGGVNPANHGILMRARARLSNLSVAGFPGDEIAIIASSGSGGATEGNASQWRIDTVQLNGNDTYINGSTVYGQHGLYISGSDVNAGKSDLVNGTLFQGYCLWDNSFLGNSHESPSCQGGGVGALVNYSGVSYYLNPTATGTQGASTTPGTNAAVWVALSTFDAAYPAWSGSGTYINGGDYRCDVNTAETLFTNAYGESGDAPSYGVYPCDSRGGQNAPGWTGTLTWITNEQGVLSNNIGGVGSFNSYGGNTFTTYVGGAPNLGGLLTQCDLTNFTTCYRIHQIGADMCADVGASSTAVYNCQTGPSTTYTFGRSAVTPFATWIYSLMIGGPNGDFNPGNGRKLFMATSIPSTTGDAVGEVALNRSAAIGQPIGWMETVRGSPDTWVAMPTLTGQAGVSCSAGSVSTTTMVVVNGVVTHC